MRAAPTVAVTAAASAWAVPALCPVVPAVAHRLGVALRLPVDRPGVALTFDDGPHAAGTAAVLDRLAAHGARATFFLVGERVRREPALAREILAAGHAVGLHGDAHRNLLRLPPRAVREDLDRCRATVADATGVAPTLYRPPYGILSAGALAELRRRRWPVVLWSRWGRDWSARATPQSVWQRAAGAVAARDVILLHDGDDYSAPRSWATTVAALPAILGTVDGRGLATELLADAATVRSGGATGTGATAAATAAADGDIGEGTGPGA